MCGMSKPKAPPPPPLPPPPPPDPKPVSEGVKSARDADKNRARYLANKGAGKRKGGSAAAGLLSPASVNESSGTLIGG